MPCGIIQHLVMMSCVLLIAEAKNLWILHGMPAKERFQTGVLTVLSDPVRQCFHITILLA